MFAPRINRDERHSTTFIESPFRIAQLAYACKFCKDKTTKKDAGDFESRGGSPQYAARYAPPGAAKDALATTSPSYFAYDWNLNTQ